ncbi:ML domain-containing protein [Kitasatospora sp. NPDC008050]|uniref:ML domain-containing protein n=1 Tax=Kitasatospora sp. NPDC008050 TaxID=3364021 RepID=UPI0036E6B241
MAKWSYVNAGSETDRLQIESITVTPDPPKPGADLKGVIKATVTAEITDGAYAEVTVKLGLVRLLQKRYDLFAELKKDGSPWSLTADSGGGAPVAPGKVELTFDGSLPREIPRAKFTISVRAYTVDDEDLAALDAQVDFLSADVR